MDYGTDLMAGRDSDAALDYVDSWFDFTGININNN